MAYKGGISAQMTVQRGRTNAFFLQKMWEAPNRMPNVIAHFAVLGVKASMLHRRITC